MARLGCPLARLTVAEKKEPACLQCPLEDCVIDEARLLSYVEVQLLMKKRREISTQNHNYWNRQYYWRKLRREDG